MVYILYFLMWRISCNSWCGVQCIVSPDVAYILFFTHTKHFVIWRTSCTSWSGVLFVFLDVAYNILYRLMRRIYCSSDIHNISWYGVHPVLPYVTYFLYFLMWHTETLCFLIWPTSCISCCGVQSIVSPDVAYILFLAFRDMAYILYFLMWRTFCISWCGVQYIVSPDVACILFFRHT